MPLLSRFGIFSARAFGELTGKKGSASISIDYLLVGGGGGGATGGGGAGAFLTGTTMISPEQTYLVYIGGGGAGRGEFNTTGVSGSSSRITGGGFTTLTAIGGGGGGNDGGSLPPVGSNGAPGGSGGGGGATTTGTTTGGLGTSGQGNNGGNGPTTLAYPYSAGGGGGAGTAGANATSPSISGNGGNGLASSISGTSVTYAGGGGGAAQKASGTVGIGGTGGGGTGSNVANVNGASGVANRGGGGGGSSSDSAADNYAQGGPGGSGIVIVSYTSATPLFNGGAITSSGGKQIHTFTSSGILSGTSVPVQNAYILAGKYADASTSYQYVSRIFRSENGIDWVGLSAPTLSASNAAASYVAYGNGIFVIIPTGGFSSSQALYSTNKGITWQISTLPESVNWSPVVFGNGTFATSHPTSTTTNRLMTTTDGSTWTSVAGLPAFFQVNAVSFTNNEWWIMQQYSATMYKSTNLTTWTAVNTGQSNGPWNIVIYANINGTTPTYVCFSSFATLRYSTNGGTSWSIINNFPVEVYSAAFGNGIFVACPYANSGGATYATSYDGVNWTRRTGPFNPSYTTPSTVTFTNGRFVLASTTPVYNSSTQQVLFSTDGITWTSSTFGDALDTLVQGVASSFPDVAPIPPPAPNTFVAVQGGNGGTGTICAQSANTGVTWTSRTIGSGNNSWKSVTYGEGLFVAISDSTGSTLAASSPDGITWTNRTLPTISGSFKWQAVAYGAGVFVALSAGVFSSSDTGAISTDGITWSPLTTALGRWTSLVFGGGKFVAVTGLPGNSSNVCAVSSDGTNWTTATLPSSQQWISVTYGNGVYVAIAYNSTAIATSTDGITWTQQTIASAKWASIAYGNGVFVGIAGRDTLTQQVVTSTDNGVTWIDRFVLPSNQYWSGIAFTGGQFVAVSGWQAASTVAATSADGYTWTQRTIPSAQWVAVAGN